VPLRFSDGYATLARVFSFDGLADGREHVAFGLGDQAAPVASTENLREPLVRPHSECLTGDVFGSQRCDCGAQLREAVERIADSGGYLLYVHLSTANARYLATKARHGGHTLDLPPPAG
jgi:GTP cyclohydrolase II